MKTLLKVLFILFAVVIPAAVACGIGILILASLFETVDFCLKYYHPQSEGQLAECVMQNYMTVLGHNVKLFFIYIRGL